MGAKIKNQTNCILSKWDINPFRLRHNESRMCSTVLQNLAPSCSKSWNGAGKFLGFVILSIISLNKLQWKSAPKEIPWPKASLENGSQYPFTAFRLFFSLTLNWFGLVDLVLAVEKQPVESDPWFNPCGPWSHRDNIWSDSLQLAPNLIVQKILHMVPWTKVLVAPCHNIAWRRLVTFVVSVHQHGKTKRTWADLELPNCRTVTTIACTAPCDNGSICKNRCKCIQCGLNLLHILELISNWWNVTAAVYITPSNDGSICQNRSQCTVCGQNLLHTPAHHPSRHLTCGNIWVKRTKSAVWKHVKRLKMTKAPWVFDFSWRKAAWTGRDGCRQGLLPRCFFQLCQGLHFRHVLPSKQEMKNQTLCCSISALLAACTTALQHQKRYRRSQDQFTGHSFWLSYMSCPGHIGQPKCSSPRWSRCHVRTRPYFEVKRQQFH